MTILVGTASWTDKTLIDSGLFYPPEVKSAEARLRFYASVFPMVEVDSSYYAIPSQTNARLWAERTPRDFTFNVKAFRLFTGHQTEAKVLDRDIRESLPANLASKPKLYYKDLPLQILDELWRRFHLAVAPLRESGKLTAIHFQFAPWVICNRDGQAHLRECASRMGEQLMAVEFRNKTWFDASHASSTLELERELGVAHVVVDSPKVETANVVPSIWEITSTRLSILRLHGRNSATWNIKGATSASDRFDWDYSQAELEALVPQIRELEQRVEVLQVIFNNNREDQGQRNARTLMDILGIER
ncbi:DUF72 domain-containing protein [Variovorax sp. LT1P1]|uniref:DUF72 domain-containing protein n=1 Tax=Variovorax sp. LT1P1 TaxID=3443730 RepID=UPI003F453667